MHDDDAAVDAIMPDAGAARRRFMRLAGPIAKPVIRSDYGVGADAAEEALAGLRDAMDRIESQLGPDGYLVGDRFSVADLTGAALFTPLIGPPKRSFLPRTVTAEVQELRDEFEKRAGGQWVLEMYERHRGARLAPAAAT